MSHNVQHLFTITASTYDNQINSISQRYSPEKLPKYIPFTQIKAKHINLEWIWWVRYLRAGQLILERSTVKLFVSSSSLASFYIKWKFLISARFAVLTAVIWILVLVNLQWRINDYPRYDILIFYRGLLRKFVICKDWKWRHEWNKWLSILVKTEYETVTLIVTSALIGMCQHNGANMNYFCKSNPHMSLLNYLNS
jgi:hypothetical protein